ncbi:MAG TPA: glycosyltransferase family 4 protein [Lacipirellulaceae bacterium]|nr:glycosyltransferase family 4 protein [Lacipirellulaceae bacterium]
MRIAFFSTMAGLPWGGSEELWSRAAAELLERGHQVAFNCVQWPTPASQLQRLMDGGATAHFRSRRRMGRTLRQTLQALRLVRLKHMPWLRKCRPDFVVISFACHTDDPQIAITCRALGIPYAILLQAAGPHNWMDTRLLDDYRAAYTNARGCFFVSHDNREIVTSNLGVDIPRAEIVDNPFTVNMNAAPSWPATTAQWKLACVARLHYLTKSQDLIIRVLRAPKWRTRPLHVTLWGHDNGNLGQFRRALDIYGLHRQIEYGGVTSDIEQLWAQHHGLLLPSRAEGNALSLIEAMMCGRVPITTRVGRAAELIDDNECGFIAPAATAELLDEVLERAWRRRDDWRMMGQRAAQAIRARHSLRPAEDFADRILAVASSTSRNAKTLAA